MIKKEKDLDSVRREQMSTLENMLNKEELKVYVAGYWKGKHIGFLGGLMIGVFFSLVIVIILVGGVL